ncbi:MAG: hypothetical protein QOG17_1897 [Gammaproteobacteria bacterium]|nr:hypothetical protein [Gammaproteobacteria bacterium]
MLFSIFKASKESIRVIARNCLCFRNIGERFIKPLPIIWSEIIKDGISKKFDGEPDHRFGFASSLGSALALAVGGLQKFGRRHGHAFVPGHGGRFTARIVTGRRQRQMLGFCSRGRPGCKSPGHLVLHNPFDQGDGVKRGQGDARHHGWLHVVLGFRRRSPFIGPSGLVGATRHVFNDFCLAGFILVDEIDPAVGKARKVLCEQVATLLGPGEICPNLVFECQTLRQSPFVSGRAVADVYA